MHTDDSSPQKTMAKALSAVRHGTALSAVPSAEKAGDPLPQESSAECTDDALPPVGLAARTYGSLALVSDRAVRRALVWGPPGAIPDERRLRHLGQAMAEVLAGRRPPKSVSDRLTERAYQELVRAGRMIDTRRPPFVGVPHVTQPNDAVVEMCLLVHCGERSHVLALRLERRGVQWLCTDFETA
ncbi:Rv3235 family protein [Nonomuraea sp. NPDC046570]|uniref:Rv3235 family protein n=1 Tax=Nonomuraea sp. NPDC046570 TaxID=3155255 RepID=UPI0033D6DE2B